MQLYDGAVGASVCSRYEDNCSYLCHFDNLIFGITEGEPTSQIYLYSINSKEIVLCDSRQIESGSLCHVSFLEKSSLLVGACYGSAIIFSIKVDTQNKQFCGEIKYCTQGQTQGRSHCVRPSLDQRLLYSANIMQDRIYRYHITQDGLEPIDFLQLDSGVGPRHLLPFADDCYYVITEYSNEILLVKDNRLVGRYSTLAVDFSGESFCSTLCMTKDCRFLYAANRGADNIAVFEVNPDFSLTPLEWFDCGSFPRHIALCDDDKTLLCANQKGNNIAIYALDKQSGRMQKQVQSIPFETPSFVMEY